MKVFFVTRGFPSGKDLMNGNNEAVQAKDLVAKGCVRYYNSVEINSSFF